MGATGMDTGDFAEVPVGERADQDGYDPDEYGGVPVFAAPPGAQS